MRRSCVYSAAVLLGLLSFAVTDAALCQTGVEFSDPLASGGFGPRMITVDAGTFRMGCTSGFRCENNTPVRDVIIERAFAMSVFEVTLGDFRAFVERTRYRPESDSVRANLRNRTGCWGFTLAQFRGLERNPGVRPRTWLQPGFPQSDNHPVVCITWHDASEYVRWLESETGRPYRLPSEAEWEYAARANVPEENLDLSSFCNLRDPDDARRCFGDPYTEVVGQSGPNEFGIYDMNRNAFEWVEDCWNTSLEGAPVDGSAWIYENCETRVFRAGGWGVKSVQHEFRDSYRSIAWTTNQMGFRVAQSMME